MSRMSRLSGALDALIAELDDVTAWEREIAAEARRAAGRRERLAASLRATIGTLDLPERGPYLDRLRDALGQPAPKPIPCQTPRVSLALDWIARRDPPEFALAELAAHLRAHGHRFGRGYLSSLLTRWSDAGLVSRIGHGRFRVNAENVRVQPDATPP